MLLLFQAKNAVGVLISFAASSDRISMLLAVSMHAEEDDTMHLRGNALC